MSVFYHNSYSTFATTPFTLAAFDKIYVTVNGGILMSNSSIAIDAKAGGNDVYVDGTVISESNAIAVGTPSGTPNSSGNGRLVIGQTGLVASFSGTAILLSDQRTSLQNAGTIQGVNGINSGFFISNPSINGSIANSGLINAASVGIVMSGWTGGISNSGTITVSGSGNGSGAGFLPLGNYGLLLSGTTIVVNNSGVIEAFGVQGSGVGMAGDGAVLVNSGTIASTAIADVRAAVLQISVAGEASRFVNTKDGFVNGANMAFIGGDNDNTVINRGDIIGNIDLKAGADSFDGRGGTVMGTISLGEGDDIFIGSAREGEIVDGGAGTDFLDFRYGGRVVVALDGTLENDGAAELDTYSGFERILGSRTGNDILRGDAGNNSLLGIGGDDVLDGSSGNDFLRGGFGTDTITGGPGNDTFVFLSPTEVSDIITDFSSVGAGNYDRFLISASTFGGGLSPGALDASQFRSRADNLAQDADDRFIFRTTDETLWFDIDGNGAQDPYLIADLQQGATMTHFDIVLV